jgi:hypothetical protein
MSGYQARLLQVWGQDPRDESLALQWIKSCVANEQCEDLYIEFKRKSQENTPIPDDADKGQLARAISGFANTDGGLLVWGVYAKATSKEEPDVAQELRPIRGLKTFVTQLNTLCGQAVYPPLPGIENRPVWDDSGQDVGFAVTIVPVRRATLTQAAIGKSKGQFFIRTGSGFFPIPQPVLAEFYTRRPLPILKLVVDLARPGETTFEEKPISAEHWKRIRIGVDRPWGRCVFRQSLIVPWSAYILNDGLGSADRVTLRMQIAGAANLSILSQEPDFVYDEQGRKVPLAWPKTCFRSAQLPQATIKHSEPVQPGQRIEVARGAIEIPGEAFNTDVCPFEVTGSAFADDSPPSEMRWRNEGEDLRAQFAPTFQDRAVPATRMVKEPPGLGDVQNSNTEA